MFVCDCHCLILMTNTKIILGAKLELSDLQTCTTNTIIKWASLSWPKNPRPMVLSSSYSVLMAAVFLLFQPSVHATGGNWPRGPQIDSVGRWRPRSGSSARPGKTQTSQNSNKNVINSPSKSHSLSIIESWFFAGTQMWRGKKWIDFGCVHVLPRLVSSYDLPL